MAPTTAGPDTPAAGYSARLELLRERAEVAWREAGLAWQSTLALRAAAPAARQPDLLSESAYARLYAQAATMPVIEQAKGVITAQQACTPDEAFDLLRKASQRSNVPVRVLAARIMSAHLPAAPAAAVGL